MGASDGPLSYLGRLIFFIGIAVKSLPPFTLVFLRVALAAMVLNLVVPAVGMRMPADRKTWSAFFGMGFLNNLMPFSLIVWGQTHIASGLASILNATTPVFTVIVAHFLTRDEKLTVNRLIGVLVGLAGVSVIIGPETLQGLGVNAFAQLAVLGAAVCYSFAGIYGRRFRRLGVHPVVTATRQVSASAIMLVTFLIPVSAILLGTVFLGEHLAWRHFLGMGLIGAGLAAIDGRLLPILSLPP